MHSSVRALFLSDIHLGTPGCQAEYLLRLLDRTHADELFLVGDIIDLEAMHRRPWWHPLHTEVIERFIGMARQGTRVVYVPGNHDAAMRRHCGQNLQGVEVMREARYQSLDGREFLVRHGDELDSTRQGASWIEALGESLYEGICWFNRWFNRARSRLDLDFHPLSVAIKERVGRAMDFIEDFEARALRHCDSLKVDGYICGHIHYANLRRDGHRLYLNDGDWVEHCTALCEPDYGGFEIWQCTRESRLLFAEPPRTPARRNWPHAA